MKIQRTLPPSAAPLFLHDLWHGLTGLFAEKKTLKKLEAEIRDYFQVRHVFCVSSGKAALTLILNALKTLSPRQQVIIPAYTCFSVPSAIVKAGLNISLCDVDPQSLDFNFDCLSPLINAKPLCVIPTHLFGLPSDVDRVKVLCQAKGVFVVEDVAQAMGVKHKKQFLGTRGDVGFFSLGRGKNITCGSGGIIVTNSDSIAGVIQREYDTLTTESVLLVMKNLCELLGMSVLMNPRLYWLPAGLPFLRLGETRFYRDFPMYKMDGVRAGILTHWRNRLEQSNKTRQLQAKKFISMMSSSDQVINPLSNEDPCYLRLPVLLKDKQSKLKLCLLSKQYGLGLSPFYPSPIQNIRELAGQLPDKTYPAASMIADRLVTLPVHSLVSSDDADNISTLIDKLQEIAPEGQPCMSLSDIRKKRVSALV